MDDASDAHYDAPAAPPDSRIGCPECDLLLRVRLPAPGETRRCPRCGFALTSGVAEPFARPLAFALTALVLLAISLACPFLAVHAAGLEHTMSLGQAITSLTSFGADGVAVVFMAFVLLVPGTMMLGVALLNLALLGCLPSRYLIPLARALFHLDAWCMADVFAIGVIVSLAKLSTLADVILGTAFWAYLGFAVCFLVTVTSLDRLTVWTAIDRLCASR